MSVTLFTDDPDPRSDRPREDKQAELVKLLGPRLVRYAGSENRTVQRAINLAITALIETGTSRAHDVRATCEYRGCHQPAVELDHEEERSVYGRLAEFFPLRHYCRPHHQLKSAMHEADLEIARLEGEARAEIRTRSRRSRRPFGVD